MHAIHTQPNAPKQIRQGLMVQMDDDSKHTAKVRVRHRDGLFFNGPFRHLISAQQSVLFSY